MERVEFWLVYPDPDKTKPGSLSWMKVTQITLEAGTGSEDFASAGKKLQGLAETESTVDNYGENKVLDALLEGVEGLDLDPRAVLILLTELPSVPAGQPLEKAETGWGNVVAWISRGFLGGGPRACPVPKQATNGSEER